MSEKKQNKKNEMSIENSFGQLDKLISQMDDDKCSIEKSMELYEKGISLINDISKKVDKIEKDLKILDKG